MVDIVADGRNVRLAIGRTKMVLKMTRSSEKHARRKPLARSRANVANRVAQLEPGEGVETTLNGWQRFLVVGLRVLIYSGDRSRHGHGDYTRQLRRRYSSVVREDRRSEIFSR